MAMFQPPPTNLTQVSLSDGTPSQFMIGWMNAVNNLLSRGFTGTITTAKLTGGGANGSMTFQNGILVSQTPAT